MPTLQVRDLPEDVYRGIVRLAEADQRSISQEAIVLLRKGLGTAQEPGARRRSVLDSLPDFLVRDSDSKPVPAPEELIREDRDR